MDGEPRILVLTQGYPISALVDDIMTSVSDSVVIDARFSDQLKSETDFRLVLHFAATSGSESIITRDPVVTALAAQLGVDVLSELPEQRPFSRNDCSEEPAVPPDQEAARLGAEFAMAGKRVAGGRWSWPPHSLMAVDVWLVCVFSLRVEVIRFRLQSA